MGLKIIMVCVAMIGLARGITDESDIGDGRAISEEEIAVLEIRQKLINKRPKPKIVGISESDMRKLNDHIGALIDPLDKNYLKNLVDKLSYDQLRQYPTDVRLTAGKVVIQFLHYNINDNEVLIKYLNPPKCKVYHETTKGDTIWSFNHSKHKQMQRLNLEFDDLYTQWFHESNDYIKYRLFDETIASEKMPTVEKHMDYYKPKFQEFFKKFDDFMNPLLVEFSDLTCNLKNFLSYFDLLPRFHETYKKVPEGYTKRLRFHDIGALLARTRDRYKVIFYRATLMKLIRNIIDEHYFYLENEKDPVVIALYQSSMLDIGDMLSFSLKGMCYFNHRMKRYYTELKFIIYSLEDASSIKPKSFKNLNFSCSAPSLLSVVVSLIVTFIVTI